jgi:biopolymer transport protein ExbD
MAAQIHTEEGDLGFQIAPMVDIVFVLMLFFVASISFQPKEFTLKASVPAPAPPGTSIVTIDVAIASSGEVYLQNQRIAEADDKKVAALIEWLNQSRDGFGELDPVVITPAPTVTHDRVMDVLYAVNEAKWKSVSLR